MEMNVSAWLDSLGLGQYAGAFKENDIDGDILVDLTADDLKELGITSLGHRKRLLAAIQALIEEDSLTSTTGRPPGLALTPESYTPGYLADRILQSRSALEGEIKQVTILFVDIKESTQLVAELSAEEASRRMVPVLEKMMAAVHRYEGTVNKLQGDGLMAMFGAPLAHEDHAVRACYAALAMRQSIVYEADYESPDPIEIRVGLHSGEVVVRAINNDLSINYDAIGITVVLAARMEQLAAPNTIRMTAETARLAEGFMEVESLGPVPVKGLEEPVEIFDLKRATSVRTRWQSTLARGLSPFVGREKEMSTLNRALQEAGAGHGQLVAMVGDAGIGKSRLTYEFIHSATSRDWQVLAASSVSYGKATTWLPVIDLLRNYFNIDGKDDTATMIDKVQSRLARLDEKLSQQSAALLSLFDIDLDEADWKTSGTLQRRRRSLNTLQDLFVHESRRQRLLLVFEDLHWIDSETQSLLDELVERLPGNQILLLVNYRPQYQDHWTEISTYWQLRVKPLPQANIEDLLLVSIGDDPSLDELKTRLLQHAEGNPLFVEESVRSLVETGALAGKPGAYQLGLKNTDVLLPNTIQAIIAERIDRLPLAEKDLLQTASVIGTKVPLPLLQMIIDQPLHFLERELELLQSAQFLFETQLFPEKEYTFKHAHTHQVAYESLLQERRKKLHARIGSAMQSLYPERRLELIEKLAEHFEKGEVWDEAIISYLLAAKKAKGKYAYDAAVDYAQKVVLLAGNSPEDFNEQRADALALMGDVESLLDDLDAANTHYEQALQYAQETAHQNQIANKIHRQHFIHRDGARIAYHSHGQGVHSLILTNPIGYIPSTIQPVVETLCQEFQVIRYDNRGTGASDPLPENYSFRSQIEDAKVVIEALDNKPVILLGLSLSAALAARLAWKYPHLVSKLVLVGMSAGQSRITTPEIEKEDRQYWEAIARGDFSKHEQYMAKFVSDRIPEPDSRDLAEIFIHLTLTVPHDVWTNFVLPDPDKDVRSLLTEINVPTLLIYGTRDLTLDPIPTANYVLERMPNAQLYLFEGKGHLPLFTAQQEFCDVLRQFILTGEVLKTSKQ
jgi:class 3 adenylate cyclase/pimeloyl-ACP methyl ester carboxylesterase